MGCKLLFLGFFLINMPVYYSKATISPSQVTQFYDSISHLLTYRELSGFKFQPTDEDKKTIRKLYSLTDRNNDPVTLAKTQYIDAFLSYNGSFPNYHRIDSLVDEASKILVPQVYPEECAKLMILKGSIYLKHNYDYASSYHLFHEAADILKKIGSNLYLAKTYAKLGNLWNELNEYERALECYKSVKEIYNHTNYKNNVYYVTVSECAVYFQQQKYLKAIQVLSDILPYAEATHDTVFIFSIYNNLGGNYAQMNDNAHSLNCFQKGLSLLNAYSHTANELKGHILTNLGHYFLNQEEYAQAVAYLEKAFVYIRHSEQKILEMQVNDLFSQLSYRTKEYHDAYEYLIRSLALKDSLAIEGKRKEVQKLRFQEELRTQNQQLQIVEQAMRIKHIQLILTIVIALFFLIIIILSFNHRKKLKETENKRLAEQLQKEEIKNRLQQIEHDKEVEAKEREIATSKLLIAEKGALMEQLLKTFEPYYEQNILPESMWKEVKRFTGTNQRKDDEWQEFTLHFDKVHPDFFKKLKELCNDLTENELRICSYLRIGMRAKQIAEMLSVSHHSILTNRYRIKKKLNMGKDESLDDFLRNI